MSSFGSALPVPAAISVLADIGGSKTSFCVAHAQTGPQLATLRVYQNRTAPDFITLYRDFVSGLGIAAPACLSLSVAGPVHNRRCQLTNLDWLIDADQLQHQLRLEQVILHNDLVATAWGLHCLPAGDFVTLQTGCPVPTASRLGIVSLGTGLGEATLLIAPDTREPCQVIPSEGGHKDFGVYDAASQALFAHASADALGQHLCLESLVSGMGLQRIYRYLCAGSPASAPTPLSDAELVSQGLRNPDSVAGQTLQMLSLLLARETANLALQNSCDAGMVIAGGLAKRLGALLTQPAFAQMFRSRGAFSAWLTGLPVRLCVNAEAPLWGCWWLAEQQAEVHN